MRARAVRSGPAADVAAEAIRGLNHATQPCAEGLTDPVDVYETLAGLDLLPTRLPQALTQLQRFLAREHAAGRVLSSTAPTLATRPLS